MCTINLDFLFDSKSYNISSAKIRFKLKNTTDIWQESPVDLIDNTVDFSPTGGAEGEYEIELKITNNLNQESEWIIASSSFCYQDICATYSLGDGYILLPSQSSYNIPIQHSGTITSVVFSLTSTTSSLSLGTLSYTIPTFNSKTITNIQPGTHTIMATATDICNNIITDSITITKPSPNTPIVLNSVTVQGGCC